MDAATIRARHAQYLFPCQINYYAEPLVLARGEGAHLWDADGNRYLDFFGGILTVSLGHCHGVVADAICDQVRTLQHTSTLYPNAPIVELAEKLAAITPGKLTKSFFTNSGTEADETAVLLAQLHTGHQEIIALRNSYHGRSMLAMSLTGHAAWRQGGTHILGIKHALAPYCYRCPLGLEYPDCGVACAKDLENLIQTTTSGRIAGMIAEPIQGVGGFVVPPPEYFEIAAGIVRRYGGVFIADEVQTGWGRTGGKMFGIEHWGIDPDILTSAKGMANGAPIGWTIATPQVADSFKGLSICTFGGNPVSCRAALATIGVIESEDLVSNAAEVGRHFRAGLEGLMARYPLIGEVRGMGLMQAMELVADRKTKEPAVRQIAQLFEETKRRKLLIGKGGLYGNVVRISPPLNASRQDVDLAIALLDESFAAIR